MSLVSFAGITVLWGPEWTQDHPLRVGAISIVLAAAWVIGLAPPVRPLLMRRPGGIELWRTLVVAAYVILIALKLSPIIENHGLGWRSLAAFLYVTPFVVVVSGFWRWWNIHNPPRDDRPFAIAVAVVGGLTLLTITFSVGTAILGVEGRLDEENAEAEGVADQRGDEITVGALNAYYVWHLLDAIPALEIPETLNWDAPYTFKDSWSGGLLIAYKLLVILPIVAIVNQFFSARRDRQESGEQRSTT